MKRRIASIHQKVLLRVVGLCPGAAADDDDSVAAWWCCTGQKFAQLVGRPF